MFRPFEPGERVISVEEVETKYLRGGFPYGHIDNPEWEKLKAQIQPGDEIREFCSPLWTWENRCGREGIVIIRDAKVIDGMITRVS